MMYVCTIMDKPLFLTIGKRTAFSSILHSLDVWHKAAKLTARVAKVLP